MYLELDRPHAAVRFLREAVRLEPSRSDILSDLRTTNALVAEMKKDSSSEQVLDPASRERFPTKSSKAPESATAQQKRDLREAVVAVAVFMFVLLVLFVPSNLLHLGADEMWLDPIDFFFWSRQLLLLLTGAAGTWFVARRHPLQVEEIAVSRIPLVAALAVGLLIGVYAPLGITKSSILGVGAMALAQVCAEEVFFRGYVGRVLLRGMVDSMTPIVISTALYAAYQLTYVAVWHGGAPGAGALFRVAVAAASSAVYALLHQKSESISIPFAAHLAAATVMIFGSIY